MYYPGLRADTHVQSYKIVPDWIQTQIAWSRRELKRIKIPKVDCKILITHFQTFSTMCADFCDFPDLPDKKLQWLD